MLDPSTGWWERVSLGRVALLVQFAFHLQPYAMGNRSVLARTTFWRGTDQERRSNCKYGSGFKGVSRPGDGNRPLLTKQVLQGFGHHKLSQNLGSLHRFCYDEGEPLSECLYLNSVHLRESPKIAATAGLLSKIWTEVISLVSYSLVGVSGVSLG